MLVDGRILRYVGPRAQLPPLAPDTPLEIISAPGMLALPGFINAHLHMALNITKGFVEDVDFKDLLFEVLYPAEGALDDETLYYAVLTGGLEAIKQGTTTLIDQYHHGALTEQVVHALGARAELSLMALDFDLAHPPPRDPATGWIHDLDPRYGLRELEENLALAQRARARGDSRVRWRIGVNTTDTVSDETLRAAAEVAQRENLGAHIHLAQSMMERRFSLERRGRTPVEFLNDIGLLDTNLMAAHCTVLTPHDVELLAASRAVIAHCPISNAKGGPVIAPIPELVARGARVALGTDSTPADMLEVTRYASVINKLPTGLTTTMPALASLRLATIDAARAIGRGDELGSLEAGKLADLILLDVQQPHLQPMQDVVKTLVYNAHGTDVRLVMVDGEIIVRSGRATRVNEYEILTRYHALAAAFWQRVGFA